MNQMEFLEELLRHRQLSHADGRALFAYRLDEAELAKVTAFVRQMVKGVAAGERYPVFEPLFCLYAAETFRRQHAGGPWAWRTVFQPIDAEVPDQPRIGHWVETGLKWWHREIIRGQAGDRRFLVTLACEGGLPLRLLQHQGARLRVFFLSLLEDYLSHHCPDVEHAVDLAARHAHRLPATLRQEVVFRLGGELIAAVITLWKELGDVPDPVASLEAQIPDWRLRLPLSAADETAHSLLTPLMSRVSGLAQAAKARLRWRGLLREGADGTWFVEKRLEFPDTVAGAAVRQWLNRPANQALPARLRIVLGSGTDSQVVAWLTRGKGSGEAVNYRREWLRPTGAILNNEGLWQAAELGLDDGQAVTPLAAAFAEPWEPELPWVFVERVSVWDWLTVGSARTRSKCARVVAPASLRPDFDVGAANSLGAMASLGRTVWEVTGAGAFLDAEGQRYALQCDAADETQESPVLVGQQLADVLDERKPYLGLPSVMVEDVDGRRSPPAGTRQWRPIGAAQPWRHDDQASGLVWVRLLDPTGAERFRRQAAVLPRGFDIKRAIGVGQASGRYGLRGLAGAEVTVAQQTGPRIEVHRLAADTVSIECPPVAGATLPTVGIRLSWPGRGVVELRLPYPQRGAAFLAGTRVLARGESVPLGRCAGLRLLVLDPAGGRRYELDGELAGTRFGFHDPLPALQSGRVELSLHAWQERLAALLASLDDPNARIRVSIISAQQCLAQVVVTHFDVALDPFFESQRVCVAPPSQARLGASWEQRVEVSVIPLWDPGRGATPLHACPDDGACWAMPANLEPGPWWVIARDGHWARFRPLLWPVGGPEGEAAADDDMLRSAIREPDDNKRRLRLADALGRLAADPDNSAWATLFACIGLGRELPPNVLDVLRNLAAEPRTLALTLFKADEESFDQVWSLADGLPFLWWLVPVDDWREACASHMSLVEEALGDADPEHRILDSVFQEFRDRAESRQHFFGPLSDWLQERLLPWRPMGSGLLRIVRGQPGFAAAYLRQLELALQGRHGPNDSWPAGPAVLGRAAMMSFKDYRFEDMADPFRPARCAPFVAADAALQAAPCDSRLVLELRLSRSFDPEWFDLAFTAALTMGLAAIPPPAAD